MSPGDQQAALQSQQKRWFTGQLQVDMAARLEFHSAVTAVLSPAWHLSDCGRSILSASCVMLSTHGTKDQRILEAFSCNKNSL
jgi:hypothetical protein